MVWLKALSWLIIFSSCNYQKHTSNTKIHRAIRYAQSDLIEKFEFIGAPYRYPGTGSDMHWWTWAADNTLLVADDDGENFDGPSNYAHLLRITGIPPHHKVETVSDFVDIPFRKMIPEGKLLRRYINGIIAIDSLLYISVYDYDWNLDRNTLYFDSLRHRLELYDSTWMDIKDCKCLYDYRM